MRQPANVLIRADGSSSMGMGHVMRTLPIAQALKERGAKVGYICADDCAQETINSHGFETFVLNSDFQNLEGELPVLLSIIKKLQANFVFVDSFFASDNYFNAIHKICPVGTFAFEKKFSDGLDIYVSYLPCTDLKWVEDNFKFKETKLLTGMKYAPFRSEFQNISRKLIREEIDRVLILSGGSDICEMSCRIIEAMEEDSFWNNKEKCVVAGPLSSSFVKLENFATEDESIKVFESVKDMSKLMKKCDIAITACGYTTFELAVCGVPMISYATSDDQVNNGFVEGVMEFIGDIRCDPVAGARLACKKAREVSEDAGARFLMRYSADKLGIDARGAYRVAEEILATAQERIR